MMIVHEESHTNTTKDAMLQERGGRVTNSRLRLYPVKNPVDITFRLKK